MEKSFQFSVLLVLCLWCQITIAIPAVEVTLYSEVGEGGSSFFTKDYIPDLTAYGFENQAKSACVKGVWLLYNNNDFSNGIGESGYIIGELCKDLPDILSGQVMSVRQVGSPTDPNLSTLTLYAYTNYRGGEVYLTNDWSNLGILSDQAYSAIVTGPDSWTVYTYENFQGSGTCLKPNETTTFAGTEVSVGFFPTYTELGSSGSIRSVKKGCD